MEGQTVKNLFCSVRSKIRLHKKQQCRTKTLNRHRSRRRTGKSDNNEMEGAKLRYLQHFFLWERSDPESFMALHLKCPQTVYYIKKSG